MVQLNNLRDWRGLGEGEVLELKKKKMRAVKLHVSCPDKTRLYYQEPGDGPKFLAQVEGLDVIQFVASGELDIIADGPVLFRTADNERSVAKPDGEKFTKMMERAPRNPEMEAIQRAVYQNVERRLAAQAAEFNRTLEMRARVDAAKIANMERELDELAESDDDLAEGTTSDDSDESESTDDGGDAAASEPPAKRPRKAAGAAKRRRRAKVPKEQESVPDA